MMRLAGSRAWPSTAEGRQAAPAGHRRRSTSGRSSGCRTRSAPRTGHRSTPSAGCSTSSPAWSPTATPTRLVAAWTPTGDPRSGSRRSRRTRRTGSAAAGAEEVPDDLSPQVLGDRGGARGARRRRSFGVDGLRGRRRDRHASRPRHRCRSTSSPATATSSSWSTTRAACGSSTPPEGSAAPTSSTRPGSARSTASPAGRTPTSPCCAATRATGCPAWPASARRPRPRSSRSTARWRRLLEALDAGDKGMPAGARTKLDAGRDYLAVAPRVVAVAHDVPVPVYDDLIPATPKDPDRLLELGRAVGAGEPAQPRAQRLRGRARLADLSG